MTDCITDASNNKTSGACGSSFCLRSQRKIQRQRIRRNRRGAHRASGFLNSSFICWVWRLIHTYSVKCQPKELGDRVQFVLVVCFLHRDHLTLVRFACGMNVIWSRFLNQLSYPAEDEHLTIFTTNMAKEHSNRGQTWTREEIHCLVDIWMDDSINAQIYLCLMTKSRIRRINARLRLKRLNIRIWHLQCINTLSTFQIEPFIVYVLHGPAELSRAQALAPSMCPGLRCTQWRAWCAPRPFCKRGSQMGFGVCCAHHWVWCRAMPKLNQI